MNDFFVQLVGYATPRNLLGTLVDPVLILSLFALLRSLGLYLLRVLPRDGLFSSWSQEVEDLFKRLLALTVAAALLSDLVFNLWLIGAHRDIVDTKRNFFVEVYGQYRAVIFLYLGIAVAAVVVNLALLQIIGKLLKVLTKWAQNADTIRGNDKAVAASFEAARWGIERASWILLLAAGTSRLAFLPESIPAVLYTGLRVFLVYAVAQVVWISLEIVVTTLDGLAKKAAEKREKLRHYEVVRPLFPTLRRALEATILVLGASFAVAQVRAYERLSEVGLVGVKIVGMLFFAQVLSTFFEFTLRELFIHKAVLEAEEKQRRLTVLPLVASIAKYVIFGFSVVMSLTQVGIDPMPVLAGAGVAGVAIGFGAQSLITDLVSGIFILWENYFIVGDYVTIGEREGFVEAISLRVTSLRDEEGRVHIVPNGKIEGIVNYSKGHVSAEVGVGVSYEMDLDKVYEALNEVSAWVGENVPDALQPSEIEGVEDFADSAVVVKLSTKVKPGTHLTTARIVRKRIKEVFDRRGIDIAYPRRVIYFHKEGSREFVNDLGEALNAKNRRGKDDALS
jgi:moderate conductance mechanosensitive channel